MKSSKSLILAILLIASLAMLVAYSIAKKSAETKLQNSVESQLLQIVNELKITLERHSYLPSLLSNDSQIINFLRTPKDSENYINKRENINQSLEFTNSISGTANVFLLNPEGQIVSSNNWKDRQNFDDENFSSSPYFKQARQNVLGRYFATESITGERYYYFASSVQFNNKVIGIILVQVPLLDIASNWTQAEVDFAVTDKNGVIFLSSNSSWNLKTITKLNKNFIDTSLRYGNKKISSLNNEEINLNQQGFQYIHLLNQKYLMINQNMELAGWDVRTLSRYSIAQNEISRNMSISAILILLTTLLALLTLNIQNQRNKFQQQAQEELENKVIERTKALKRSQEDLIQAAKMAALGQLSTGITHEINNPLTAIRSYADNAEQFLKKDKFDVVESNLKEISKLTENMAAITSQLKSFARKSKGELRLINIDDSITSAISIVSSKIISSGTEIKFEKNQEQISNNVVADEIWLSQILVNLISNAISATNNIAERKVWITVLKSTDKEDPHCCIEIKDNGTGIDENNLDRIFEPFFTTKPTTKGLGLGLSISYNLARDMNGSLEARNHESGGALFTLCLPSSTED